METLRGCYSDLSDINIILNSFAPSGLWKVTTNLPVLWFSDNKSAIKTLFKFSGVRHVIKIIIIIASPALHKSNQVWSVLTFWSKLRLKRNGMAWKGACITSNTCLLSTDTLSQGIAIQTFVFIFLVILLPGLHWLWLKEKFWKFEFFPPNSSQWCLT